MVSSVPGGDARPTASDVRRDLVGTRFADLRWVAQTGSTNRDLMALAADGAPEGMVLVADHQTAGRGRLGRVWTAPPRASLLLSVLMRPPIAVGDAHLLTAIVGLAAIEACVEVAGVQPGLKWPNDLVVASPLAGGAERKLAGVLAESSVRHGRFEAVVVGLGLNVNWPTPLPDEVDGVAVALNHLTGGVVKRGALAVSLLLALDRLYTRLLAPGGAGEVHRGECAASLTIGREVRVIRAGDEIEGTAVGIDPDGTLRVEVGGAVLAVPVGDVVHLRPGGSNHPRWPGGEDAPPG